MSHYIRYIKNLLWILVSGYGPKTAGENIHDGDWDDGHIHYFTHQDMRELFRSVGFHNVSSRALVNMLKPSIPRQLLDRVGNARLVREFLSGNILLTAVK